LERLRALADIRAEATNLKEQKRQLELDFQAEHMELFQHVQTVQKEVGIQEALLRDVAVTEWMATDPHPPKLFMPGITIRESQVATFDREFATKWALEHRLALKLDEATYRKLVLLKQAPGQVNTEYTAAIASDLDAALAKEIA